MTLTQFTKQIEEYIRQLRYDRKILWSSDEPFTDITLNMPIKDYMELTYELISNKMVSPGPGFAIKQIMSGSGVNVHLIESESLRLRVGTPGVGDNYFGHKPQAPVIQMQTLPHRA